ncbi:MAG: excinuclease ABC subunit A, partial [Bradymonadia bacterium]
GMCPGCRGLGTEWQMDPDKVVPDHSLSINGGALLPLERQAAREERWNKRVLHAFCDFHKVDRRAAWSALPERHRHLVLSGADEVERLEVKGRKTATRIQYEGALGYLMRRLQDADTDAKRERLSAYLSTSTCGICNGGRLRPESASVHFAGMSLVDACASAIEDTASFFQHVELEGREAAIGADLLGEVRERLRFLLDVGLGYLTLDRPGPTLSGGEAQRIRLASQLGSQLTGVLYVLDEPSIGLHQRDNDRLLATLLELRDRGNSVLVVEHDRDTIEAADFVADFGPGAGVLGGELTYAGTPEGLTKAKRSVTGAFLAGRERIEVPEKRRQPGLGEIVVHNARANNLRGVDVTFPIGQFTCVTGVSGAGKSTVVNEILYPAIANHLYKDIRDVAAHDRITGFDTIDKIIQIDQQPIGRTPRSNPATYVKVFDEIRKFFATLPDAKIYGYTPGRFSFNVAGGRCETCSGGGVRRIEMSFMADVFVQCEVCRGRRFGDATLRVRYKGHSIHDVLNMSFDEALELFPAHPKVARMLRTVVDVGLGYVKLGQSSPTLSGGEAQRAKLSRELAKIATGDTLYILDEPSTGLHFEDIRRLLGVLDRLVDAGNTVIVIEHNMDIIKCADHVIDMGPEGGSGGGNVVATGTPEEVAASERGYTSTYLSRELQRGA